MSPNTIKKKCQNFLSTLIRLAGVEATKTASNVKKLIQNLIVSNLLYILYSITDLFLRLKTCISFFDFFKCSYFVLSFSLIRKPKLQDGTIEPEEFSTQLQKELQSNHQPYLIHFLKVCI